MRGQRSDPPSRHQEHVLSSPTKATLHRRPNSAPTSPAQVALPIRIRSRHLIGMLEYALQKNLFDLVAAIITTLTRMKKAKNRTNFVIPDDMKLRVAFSKIKIHINTFFLFLTPPLAGRHLATIAVETALDDEFGIQPPDQRSCVLSDTKRTLASPLVQDSNRVGFRTALTDMYNELEAILKSAEHDEQLTDIDLQRVHNTILRAEMRVKVAMGWQGDSRLEIAWDQVYGIDSDEEGEENPMEEIVADIDEMRADGVEDEDEDEDWDEDYDQEEDMCDGDIEENSAESKGELEVKSVEEDELEIEVKTTELKRKDGEVGEVSEEGVEVEEEEDDRVKKTSKTKDGAEQVRATRSGDEDEDIVIVKHLSTPNKGDTRMRRSVRARKGQEGRTKNLVDDDEKEEEGEEEEGDGLTSPGIRKRGRSQRSPIRISQEKKSKGRMGDGDDEVEENGEEDEKAGKLKKPESEREGGDDGDGVGDGGDDESSDSSVGTGVTSRSSRKKRGRGGEGGRSGKENEDDQSARKRRRISSNGGYDVSDDLSLRQSPVKAKSTQSQSSLSPRKRDDKTSKRVTEDDVDDTDDDDDDDDGDSEVTEDDHDAEDTAVRRSRRLASTTPPSGTPRQTKLFNGILPKLSSPSSTFSLSPLSPSKSSASSATHLTFTAVRTWNIHCSLCTFKTVNIHDLTEHYKTIHSRFLCGKSIDSHSYCMSHFGHMPSLSTHRTDKHTTVSPHYCRLCSKRFATAKSYRNHVIQKHTPASDRPFPCFQCNNTAFATKALAQQHMRNQHEVGFDEYQGLLDRHKERRANGGNDDDDGEEEEEEEEEAGVEEKGRGKDREERGRQNNSGSNGRGRGRGRGSILRAGQSNKKKREGDDDDADDEDKSDDLIEESQQN